jgi:ABC-type nitrate/sulfonate/bicarbonate transport system substrate-binding protein
MATLIKTTQDGRKLEVIGFAIYLDGVLEAVDLTEVKMHPAKRKIWSVMPEATHVAGRVALTPEEAEAVTRALKEAEAQMLANPVAINERFRIAAMWKAREQGIE